VPARRPDPPIEIRRFTPEKAEWAVKLLEARIADVKAMDPKGVRHDDERVYDLSRRIRTTILEVFGEHSQEHRDHQYRGISDYGSYSAPVVTRGFFDDDRFAEASEDAVDQARFGRGLTSVVGVLEGLIRTVGERTDAPRPAVAAAARAAAVGRDVFIVHGRKDGPRDAVARFVERFGLKAIILQEEASGGRTIIEKVEHHSEDVGFAVVLLTAEDRGGLMDGDPKTFKLRARQNVILELGYFVGKIGRNRVGVLHEDGVEIPSDFHGVVYIRLDSGGAWKLMLAREMSEAGLKIDMNLAIR
jgi:predicted nucleotide-binding protein